MEVSEIKSKIEKIKGMSGLSDKAKADMITAWEKKLPKENEKSLDDDGKKVPGFKHLREKKDGSLVIKSKGEFLERWVPLVAENLKIYTGLSKSQNLKRFKSELIGEKSKEMYERGVKAGEAARFLQQDKESEIGKASENINKKVKTKTTHKYKGKTVPELDDKDCEDLIKETAERRKKAAKAEKKSKSRPIIEKVTVPIVKAVKKVIENIPAADLKDDPKKELSMIDQAIAAAKEFMMKLKKIFGEDWDKETVDGEMKDLHALGKELHKKYGE